MPVLELTRHDQLAIDRGGAGRGAALDRLAGDARRTAARVRDLGADVRMRGRRLAMPRREPALDERLLGAARRSRHEIAAGLADMFERIEKEIPGTPAARRARARERARAAAKRWLIVAGIGVAVASAATILALLFLDSSRGPDRRRSMRGGASRLRMEIGGQADRGAARARAVAAQARWAVARRGGRGAGTADESGADMVAVPVVGDITVPGHADLASDEAAGAATDEPAAEAAART